MTDGPLRRATRIDPEPPAPAGFARLLAVDPASGLTNGTESLLVPIPMVAGINRARRVLVHNNESAIAWKRACVRPLVPLPEERNDNSNASTAGNAAVSAAAAPSPPAPPSLQNHPAASPAEPAPAPPAPSPPRQPRTKDGARVRVITEADIRARRDDAALKLKLTLGERKAEEKAMDELLARGEHRIVGMGRDWRVRLRQLGTEMPNFSRVVSRIEACCALSQFTGTPLRIPPMLLAGPPGVGKTHFAMRLAGVLGVATFIYAMESAETVATLTGSDKHWANSEPGTLFKLIVTGHYANPVVVVDELDKANRGSNYKPASALHAVLEPGTARQLRDKSMDLSFDASWVVYLATANRLSPIDPSLVSRFELFHIEAPSPRDSVSIARSIGRDVLKELKLTKRFEAPCGEVIQQLALLGGPRQIHKVLKAALGRAVSAGRMRVTVQDLLDGYDLPGKGGGDEPVH